MRKLTAVAVLVLSVASASAFAENSVSMGYAHSSSDGVNLNGGNIKYNYTPDGQAWGVIGSLTLTGSTDKETYKADGYKFSSEIDYGYGSAMVGASYAINDYVKPYVMAGVGRAGVEVKQRDTDGYSVDVKDTSTAFAYSVGVQVAPIKNVFIDASYEGTKLFGSQVNTFVIGAGYRF